MLDRVFNELVKVPESIRGKIDYNCEDRTVKILLGIDSEAERTKQLAELSSYWRKQDTFKLLRGWRNELWPVYARTGELLFSFERAAVGLLGTMRYGVHMVAYVKDESAPFGFKIWIPRRAANKSTFPGMLDNTVAGGLATGEDPFECLVREADEEASLPADVVRARTKLVGTVTYIYVTSEEHVGDDGFIFPECQWLYDLELPANVVPQPKDGEVQEFKLCTVDEVLAYLANGEFKNNCGLVSIDFFIRHGVLTKDNEPNLVDIHRRMHREMPFPGAHTNEKILGSGKPV